MEIGAEAGVFRGVDGFLQIIDLTAAARRLVRVSAALEATLPDHDRDLARATRALLRRPLIRHDADPDAFQLVRRHATELRGWFDQNSGWRLHVDTEVARLFKLGEPDAR